MKTYALEARTEEEAAVVTARTSRSPNTFAEILTEVQKEGYEKFLEQNVLGYGHDSVAEGAHCPWIVVEDVSDLAGNILATADPQLRVQMTSTRYQKMEARNIFHDSGEGGDEVLDLMMARLRQYQELAMGVTATTSLPKSQRLTLARDISRGWMPAGIKTQLAVRHDARGMRDTICYLLGHHMPEVNSIGENLLSTTKVTIETLLNRHVNPAPMAQPVEHKWMEMQPGEAWLSDACLEEADQDKRLHAELDQWVQSGYRRRHRIAACPHGPYLAGGIYTDWGAYRDLRRNRTIHQTDLLPDPQALPEDPLWAFRDLYPEVCDELGSLPFDHHSFSDPYLATMNSLIPWHAGGHALNWAYALRLRSKVPGCHPAYAIPMRHLMRQITQQAPRLAGVMGIVQHDKALLGVEFSDRVG
jgi:hypothetical protein